MNASFDDQFSRCGAAGRGESTRKLTVRLKREATGRSFNVAGLNDHWRIASSAARSASATGERSGLVSTRRSRARNPPVGPASAASPREDSGTWAVGALISFAVVLGAFAVLTMVTFVGLTVVATAVGYQMRGAWLEDHANTITALILIVIGVIAYVGL